LNSIKEDWRLIYTFHDTEYLGGAHGAFGVMYLLMTALRMVTSFDDQFTTNYKGWYIYILGVGKGNIVSGDFKIDFFLISYIDKYK